MSKVVVGMSGGVDSSVAAYLLKEQGYDVIGVTMQIWQDEEQAAQEENGGCCGLSAVDDARRVAAALEIPYYVMNFKKEFKENVIDYFVEEYQNGRTPNPCIACNRYVKVGISFTKKSLDRCRVYCDGTLCKSGYSWQTEDMLFGALLRLQKIRLMHLYNLTQEQLKRTLMPVGEIHKRRGTCHCRKDQSQDCTTNRTARISALCRMATMPLILKKRQG